MVIKSHENSIGAWAFLIGFILAVLIGLATTIFVIPEASHYNSQIYGVLILLGLVVGFAIVPGRDSQVFLLAGAVLVIVSRFGIDSVTGSFIGIGIGDAVTSIFRALLALFVPATIVVALKTVFSISKI